MGSPSKVSQVRYFNILCKFKDCFELSVNCYFSYFPKNFQAPFNILVQFACISVLLKVYNLRLFLGIFLFFLGYWYSATLVSIFSCLPFGYQSQLEIGCKQGFQYTPRKIIWSWPITSYVKHAENLSKISFQHYNSSCTSSVYQSHL